MESLDPPHRKHQSPRSPLLHQAALCPLTLDPGKCGDVAIARPGLPIYDRLNTLDFGEGIVENKEGFNFRKSSFSGDGGCIEVGSAGRTVAIRDSKNTDGPILRFTEREWDAFLKGVFAREFD
jgi:hypothetical protein